MPVRLPARSGRLRVEPVSPDNPPLHMDNDRHLTAWYKETAITTLQRKVKEEVVNAEVGNEPFNCVRTGES